MADTLTQTLNFTDDADNALSEGRKMAAAVLAEGQRIAAIVPHRLEAIKQAGLITVAEVEGCREKLASHEGALDLVQNLLDIRAREKVAWAKERLELEQKAQLNHQGQGVPSEKSASGDKSAFRVVKHASDNYVGHRLGEGELAESDIKLMQGLGLPLPAGCFPIE